MNRVPMVPWLGLGPSKFAQLARSADVDDSNSSRLHPDNIPPVYDREFSRPTKATPVSIEPHLRLNRCH